MRLKVDQLPCEVYLIEQVKGTQDANALLVKVVVAEEVWARVE